MGWEWGVVAACTFLKVLVERQLQIQAFFGVFEASIAQEWLCPSPTPMECGWNPGLSRGVKEGLRLQG